MAPVYRHSGTGQVVNVREDGLIAGLVSENAEYERVDETFIPVGPSERAEDILAETLERLAATEQELAEARELLDAEPVAATDPPSPIGEDGIPVLTDPEQTEGEPVEQAVPAEEVTPDAGNADGRGEAPRTRARRR